MTVYDFARALMRDNEFNKGGIIENERKYLDGIGFGYSVKGGCISSSGEDLSKFYEAMYILKELNDKYKKINKPTAGGYSSGERGIKW